MTATEATRSGRMSRVKAFRQIGRTWQHTTIAADSLFEPTSAWEYVQREMPGGTAASLQQDANAAIKCASKSTLDLQQNEKA